MKKILNWFTEGVIGEIGKVIDNLFTNDEERIKAKNEVFKILKEKELELQKMQTEIIVAEAQGNWLQRSWRPILMLALDSLLFTLNLLHPYLTYAYLSWRMNFGISCS